MSSDSTVSVLVSSCDSGSVCAYNAHSTRYHSASRNIISAIFKHWRLFVFFLCHGAEKEASDSVNRTSIRAAGRSYSHKLRGCMRVCVARGNCRSGCGVEHLTLELLRHFAVLCSR